MRSNSQQELDSKTLTGRQRMRDKLAETHLGLTFNSAIISQKHLDDIRAAFQSAQTPAVPDLAQ
jgi:hypothetical protein